MPVVMAAKSKAGERRAVAALTTHLGAAEEAAEEAAGAAVLRTASHP
jgi:hypothetical protein